MTPEFSVDAFAQWFASLDHTHKQAAATRFKELTGGTLSAFSNPKPVEYPAHRFNQESIPD